MEFDADFVGKALVEAADKCATTSKVDTVLYDVGIQFRRGLLKSAEHSSLNLRDCLFDAVAYFLV